MEPCIFSGFPLDPADHLRSNQQWLSDRLGESSSRFVVYGGGRPLMDVAEGLRPAFKSIKEVGDVLAEADWVFIGLDQDIAVFAVELKDFQINPHEKFIDLRSVAFQVSGGGFSDMPSLLGRGKMLLDWNGRRHFCSCCGSETRAENGGYLRKCLDKNCAAEHFPRTDPVVIMLVLCGDKCLLGRGRGWPEGNFSALAGFMEPGETMEEAVRREVLEEAGIKVGKVSYIKSQPWPFPSSLMIGVMAEALSTDITIDTNELEEAHWFDKQQIRGWPERGGEGWQEGQIAKPPTIAIARHLLEEWLKQG